MIHPRCKYQPGLTHRHDANVHNAEVLSCVFGACGFWAMPGQLFNVTPPPWYLRCTPPLHTLPPVHRIPHPLVRFLSPARHWPPLQERNYITLVEDLLALDPRDRHVAPQLMQLHAFSGLALSKALHTCDDTLALLVLLDSFGDGTDAAQSRQFYEYIRDPDPPAPRGVLPNQAADIWQSFVLSLVLPMPNVTLVRTALCAVPAKGLSRAMYGCAAATAVPHNLDACRPCVASVLWPCCPCVSGGHRCMREACCESNDVCNWTTSSASFRRAPALPSRM